MADKITGLSLKPWHFHVLQGHAYSSEQEECGILVGHIDEKGIAYVDEIRPIPNTYKGLGLAFEFEPQVYLHAIQDTDYYTEDAPFKLLGMWHTHPGCPGYPSTIDWNAALNGQVIEGLYFIYSTPDNSLHAYVWDGQTFKVIRRLNEKA